jgi:3-hydroxyacyl-CoA dehydrogenase
MTVDELETALQTTIQSRLEAAVEAGDLTQEQADRLLERLDEGLPFFGRPLR